MTTELTPEQQTRFRDNAKAMAMAWLEGLTLTERKALGTHSCTALEHQMVKALYSGYKMAKLKVRPFPAKEALAKTAAPLVPQVRLPTKAKVEILAWLGHPPEPGPVLPEPLTPETAPDTVSLAIKQEWLEKEKAAILAEQAAPEPETEDQEASPDLEKPTIKMSKQKLDSMCQALGAPDGYLLTMLGKGKPRKVDKVLVCDVIAKAQMTGTWPEPATTDKERETQA